MKRLTIVVIGGLIMLSIYLLFLVAENSAVFGNKTFFMVCLAILVILLLAFIVQFFESFGKEKKTKRL
jgi:hypothetical protein